MMDGQRGRSPSQGQQQNHIKQNHSPSPHAHLGNGGHMGLGLGLDNPQNSQQYLSGNFNQNNNITFPDNNNNFFLNQQSQTFGSGPLDPIPNFDTSQNFNQQGQGAFDQQPGTFTQDLLSANISPNFNGGDFSLFSNQGGQNSQFEQQFLFPDSADTSSTLNPAELNMASPQTQPTPPHLLRPEAHTNSSTQKSPSFNQGQFQRSPSHSRHTSLGPESAAYPQGNVDWSSMSTPFQAHRRTPSEYSDVSASSAAPSPNLGHHDSFESVDNRHSPMQHPQDSSLYNDVLAIGNFSLSDPQVHRGTSPGHGPSPAHSPAISPRLNPQPIPLLNQQNGFMLGMDNSFVNQQNIYGLGLNQFARGQHTGSLDMGQAQQMVPPEINVEFAPASRQNSFEPPKPSLDQDALTPPERGRRRRAASDPFNSGSVISRPHTPSSSSPGLGAELQSGTPSSHRSLSPNDRSNATSPSRRRQSTSSLPNRDYILGLADPEYQGTSAEGGNSKRVQKHPATFQCTLCPKRFTRAYNLRSHLRTHTDERPFVCTVCGKAFARQHDRKRHEGLHSGEKKFVCRGELKQGGAWGCGRKFARADALGRHFRSEAGRICIKPLLDEEAIERNRVWQEQRMQDMAMQQPQSVTLDSNGFPIDPNGNYKLPAALLAQYPALAGLSWPDLAQGDPGIDDDISGRSSFDASGSEYYEEDEGGYVSSGPGPQQFGQFGQQPMQNVYNAGYSNDIGR